MTPGDDHADVDNYEIKYGTANDYQSLYSKYMLMLIIMKSNMDLLTAIHLYIRSTTS